MTSLLCQKCLKLDKLEIVCLVRSKVTLLRFCQLQEIADAIEYFSKKSFIHRDIASTYIISYR